MDDAGSIIANAPHIPMEDMERKADELFQEFRVAVGWKYITRSGFKFDDFYESVIWPKYRIVIEENCRLGMEGQDKVLGSFSPATRTARIDEEISVRSEDRRRVFTLFHEVLGHGVLQGEWLRKVIGIDKAGFYTSTTAKSIGPQATRRLERQANLFAGLVAAPRPLLRFAIAEVFGTKRPLRYIGPTRYTMSVDQVRRVWCVNSARDYCVRVASSIQRYFGGLSTEAISYQVESCGAVQLSDRATRFGSRDPSFADATQVHIKGGTRWRQFSNRSSPRRPLDSGSGEMLRRVAGEMARRQQPHPRTINGELASSTLPDAIAVMGFRPPAAVAPRAIHGASHSVRRAFDELPDLRY